MRAFLLILATLFAFSAFAATGEVTVKTTGMSCTTCVDKMKTEVSKIKDQLTGVTVSVEFNKATIKVDDPSITAEQLAAKVKLVEEAAVKSNLTVVKDTAPAKKAS